MMVECLQGSQTGLQISKVSCSSKFRRISNAEHSSDNMKHLNVVTISGTGIFYKVPAIDWIAIVTF